MKTKIFVLTLIIFSILTLAGSNNSASSYKCKKYSRLHFGTLTVRKQVLDLSASINYYTGLPVIGPIDVDHVYPLVKAYPFLCGKGKAVLKGFNNDLDNLVVTTSFLNGSKGSKVPGTWMPVNKTRGCLYGRKFLAVAKKWSLGVTAEDRYSTALACLRSV